MTTNTKENNKDKKVNAVSALQTGKAVCIGFFKKLRHVLHGMNFWIMSLICLGLRCFVVYPLGQLFALIIGTVWCFENWATVRSAGNHMIRFFGGFVKGVSHESYSMWYEHEGEKIIDDLMAELHSKTGVNYCNLVNHIKMPAESHWYAISVALNKKGIRTQVSKDAFYIQWATQDQKTQ